jgi:leucyl-tRNA synthetase
MKRRSHGIVLGPDNRKMSKSFGNVVNPDDIVGKYGADTLRLYEAFMGPFEQMIAWSEESLEGCYKFLGRVWRLYQEKINNSKSTNQNSRILLTKLHQTIKKVGEDIENMKFNTAVAAMMEFTNAWNDVGNLNSEEAGMFLKILAPFAPHIAEELWQKVVGSQKSVVGKQKTNNQQPTTNNWSIHTQPWPIYDPKLIVEENMTIVVQINGKVRSQLTVNSRQSTVQSEVELLAKSNPVVAKRLDRKEVKKIIFVQGKLINFVVV